MFSRGGLLNINVEKWIFLGWFILVGINVNFGVYFSFCKI